LLVLKGNDGIIVMGWEVVIILFYSVILCF